MSNKVVLITGCSSGFGYVAAKYLQERNYSVIPTVRKEKDLALLPNSVHLDLTWPEEKIRSAIGQIIKRYKKIDVLVNNAGYGHLGEIIDFSEKDVRSQFEVNFIGTFKVTKCILKHFRSMSSGLIINVSSILGLFSVPSYGIYSASKFALEAMTQTLRLEEARYGIKICSVNPGAYKTKFNAKSVVLTKGESYDPAGYGRDPIEFALLTQKIINTDNPKTNYILGDEALKVRILTHLPSFIRESLLIKYLG